MDDVAVIEEPGAAILALDPTRAGILAHLAEPGSAATLAPRVGLARQKVNYHLRALEAHHLVQEVERRRWGGLTERLFVAKAASYVVSPAALGPVASDPERSRDRLSASYLIALAARVVREVAELVRRSAESGKRLATLSIDTEVRFRSPADRAAFTQALADSVKSLVARYHDASAPEGRAHRVVLVAHPLPHATAAKETS